MCHFPIRTPCQFSFNIGLISLILSSIIPIILIMFSFKDSISELMLYILTIINKIIIKFCLIIGIHNLPILLTLCHKVNNVLNLKLHLYHIFLPYSNSPTPPMQFDEQKHVVIFSSTRFSFLLILIFSLLYLHLQQVAIVMAQFPYYATSHVQQYYYQYVLLL